MPRFASIAAMCGALLFTTGAWAADLCANPRQTDGFKTCADVAKAEAEGQVAIYSTDPEDGSEKVLARFHKMVPKIFTGHDRHALAASHAQYGKEWNKLAGMR